MSEPDVSIFIEALRQYGGVRVSAEGPYTAVDQYRDFSAVFSTDQGKRVLAQIVNLCEDRMPKPDAGEALLAAYVERRRVGQQIAAWATVPPREQPVQPAKPTR